MFGVYMTNIFLNMHTTDKIVEYPLNIGNVNFAR